MIANVQDIPGKTFDYVIVGGGTAGLTLAARLTADPAVSVLVLEYGEAHLNNKDILSETRFGLLLANKTYSYQHRWTTQKHAADRQGIWERGKGLGGSSAINFMGWFRPAARDIDDISRLGNPHWTFANYLPRVNRTEGLVEPSPASGIDTRQWMVGRDGPVKLSCAEKMGEGEKTIMQTLANDGFKQNLNPYNGDPRGYYRRLATRDPNTNTRSYATTAYYLPNAARSNLVVVVNALVRRILLSDTDAGAEVTATGVEFEQEGAVYEVKAGREVVLCAGTLSSSHVLELSGIGRRDVLARIGVPLKVELPGVGENMQEHVYVGMAYELAEGFPADGSPAFISGATAHQTLTEMTPGRAAELHGRIGGVVRELEAEIARMEGEIGRAEGNSEEAEMAAKKGDLQVKRGLLDQFRLLEGRYSDRPGEGSPNLQWIVFPAFLSVPKKPEEGKRYFTLFTVLNHAFSRGTVHATSNDPSTPPEIDPNYLAHGIDLELMYEHVSQARRLTTLSPLKEMIAKEHNPGPEVQSEEDVKKWITDSFTTIYHTVGTCSMLPRDKGGVVSPELKVYGTTNVRVADVSVVPLHVGANTMSTAYGLGEIAADIIEGKWPRA